MTKERGGWAKAQRCPTSIGQRWASQAQPNLFSYVLQGEQSGLIDAQAVKENPPF
jgi:hypothetical protein